MKVALLIPKGKRSPAVINTIRSLAKFSEEMGIQTIGNPRKDLMLPKNGYNIFLNFINENIHFYKRLMLDARRFETLIVPYPSGIFNPLLKNPRYLKAIIDIRSVELKLWRKIGGKKRLIIYSFDLPILQAGWRFTPEEVERAKFFEREFLSLADIIMVFNEAARNYLMDQYGIDGNRIIEFEIVEEFSEFAPPSEKPLKDDRRVVWIGNLSKNYMGDFLKSIKPNPRIKYLFYGVNADWLKKFSRKDVEYVGILPPEELQIEISRYDFGLIIYSNEMAPYLKFGTSAKFSTYMVSGLPVLVKSNLEYPSELVKKYNVGWIFEEEKEIPEIVASITEKEYQKVRRNVLNLGEKISSGYFTKKAIKEALRRCK